MSLTKSQFSAAEIDQAGRVLARSSANDKDSTEWSEAVRLINQWRASHAHPLNVFRNNLSRKVRAQGLVAQRLKRMPSIEVKLRRFSTFRLSQMHDIGGCRVVVRRASRAFNLATDVIGTTRHELVRHYNYIEHPRESGYGGLHLVYAYNSERHKQWQGLKTEIQVRSQLQHQWATAVETVGTFIGDDLKSGVGDVTWLRFFALMSSAIAHQEDTPSVPSTPINQNELRDEIRECDQELGGVSERLAAFQRVTDRLAHFTGRKRWVLIELNLNTHELTGRVFRPSDWELANSTYLEKEIEIQGDPQREVALVSTNTLAELRRAYPNYFAALTQFRNRVRRTIA